MTAYTVTGLPVTIDGGASVTAAVQNTGSVVLTALPLGRQIPVGQTVTIPLWRDVRTTLQTAGQTGAAAVTLTSGTPAARPGPGAVTLDAGPAAAMSVAITGGTWYSDEGLTTAVTSPVAVTGTAVIYPAATGSVTFAMTVGSASKTVGLNLVEGCAETVAWTPVTDAERAQTAIAAGSAALAAKADLLQPGTVQTTASTAVAWRVNRYNATSGPLAPPLPAVAAAGTVLEVVKTDATTNTVTAGGEVLRSQLDAVRFVSDGSAWVSGGVRMTRTASSGAFVQLPAGGSAGQVPTITTPGTPPTVSWGDFVRLGIAGREVSRSQFAAALLPFHVSLGNIATAPVSILFVGDSRPEGAGTTNVAYRLPQAFADLMRRRFQPSSIVGGFGYIPVRYAQTLTGVMVADTIGGGIGTSYGLGRRSLNFTSAGQTITFTFTGTGFDLHYRTDPSLGVFSYAVDGGGATNITPTAATGTAKTSVTGLSAGSHTVVLTRVSGTTVVAGLVALNGDEAAGLRVYDGGHSGYKISDYTSGAWVDDVSLAQPSLVVLSLLTNDFGGGSASQPRTAAQAQADLGTLMTNIAAKCTISPSFVIEAPPYPNNALTGTYDPWSAYIDAAYAAAAARTDCLVLDTYRRINSTTTASTAGGMTSADKIHQTNAGYRTIASALADLVSPS